MQLDIRAGPRGGGWWNNRELKARFSDTIARNTGLAAPHEGLIDSSPERLGLMRGRKRRRNGESR